MTDIYLGVHRGRWLEDPTLRDIPLFVTYTTLSGYRPGSAAFPRATVTRYAIDSGAYTEIARYGRWRDDARTFGEQICRFVDDLERSPDFVAVQDYPCEEAARMSSRLTVRDHQRLTVCSVVYLRSRFPSVPWLPVLQGQSVSEYVGHVRMYRSAGIDLRVEPRVGLGSVCTRQSTMEVAHIVATLVSMGIRLHGFGVSRPGLRRIGSLMHSTDSMAWSATARRSRIRMPDCTHAGLCNNCPRYARHWYAQAQHDLWVSHCHAPAPRG